MRTRTHFYRLALKNAFITVDILPNRSESTHGFRSYECITRDDNVRPADTMRVRRGQRHLRYGFFFFFLSFIKTRLVRLMRSSECIRQSRINYTPSFG
jgi:hypothetical protein